MDTFTFAYRDNSGTIDHEVLKQRLEENAHALLLAQKGEAKHAMSLGWHDVDTWAGKEWVETYNRLAKKIQKDADVLVVVGIGGSNQAARAVYEAMGKKSQVSLVWMGNTLSPFTVNEVLASLDDKRNIYVDCIAKNFETLEPGIGFRIMRDYLRKRYKDAYASHVIVTFTENTKSWALAKEHGYTMLPFPEDIGGRYTALSPVGLFPLAVAGFDIARMAQGAKDIRSSLMNEQGGNNMALLYATLRTELWKKGKSVELLSYFEPRFFRFAKWWKQLFGESEGKDDKGLLPMDTCFSEDLHSLGQFIQDGSPMLFETFLNVTGQDSSYVLKDDDVADGFHYLDGKDLFAINKAAYEATVMAHAKRFPCLIFSIPAIDEYGFGQLFYFFAFACYVSCLITNVNPFDQSGVEAYKTDMFALLGK